MVRIKQDWQVYPQDVNNFTYAWIGERLPLVRPEKSFESDWLTLRRSETSKSFVFVLQAAYVDRYGQTSPTLPQQGKSKCSTYKFSKGEYLYDDQYDILNSRSANQPGDLATSSIGFNPTTLQWMSSIRHYENCFKINPAKLEFLTAKVERTGNLCIFLSSPFDGYAEERERFMQKFPSLSRICQNKGIFLSVVDMRWGISDKLSHDSKTVFTCLTSIDKSDIFIGYFAARYGTCTKTENKEYPWIEKDVSFATSFQQFQYISQYTDRSVTEMEFQHAFAHSNFYERCDKPISFVLYRDPNYDSRKYETLLGEKAANNYREEEGCSELKARLKSEVERISSMPEAYLSLFNNYIDPEMGSNLMFACCNSLIKNVLQRLPVPANYSSVYQAHLSFARSRIAIYVPFATTAAAYAKQYVTLEAGLDCNPLIIAGESGSGKSSLMADLIFNSNLDLRFCVFHFIGCTSESTYLPHMLRRIYNDLCAIIKSYLPKNMEFPHVDELNLNNIFDPIIHVYNMENELTNALPVIVIVIDALNQLVDEPYSEDYTDLPSNFLWIPEKLPEKLRLVVSCIDITTVTEDMTTSLTHLHEKTIPTLRSRCPKAQIMFIPVMTIEHRRNLSTEYLNKYCKEFNDDEIMTELCNRPQCTNPMFLSIALDYLVRHASWSYLKFKLYNEVLDAETVPKLLQLSIQKIEATNGPSLSDTIEKILCLIYCSRVGLTSQELIDIIKIWRQQDKVPDENAFSDLNLNQTTWYRMENALSLFIMVRGGFFNITHDYVRQAIEQHYFGNGRTLASLDKEASSNNESAQSKLKEAKLKLKKIHTLLSHFFQLQSYGGKASLERETIEEIRYHQKLGSIRPSILVGVRICPIDPNNPEYYEQMKSCVVTEGCRLTLCNWEHDQISGMQSFNFDFILNSSDKSRVNSYASQERTFKTLKDALVTDAVDGKNVSMLAYGQTGSGKSYTMFGKSSNEPSHRGLIPRMMEELLKRLNEKENIDGWVWKATCTMVEIYKDNAYDLLRGVSIGQRERKDKSKVTIGCYRPSEFIEDSDNNADFARTVQTSKTIAVETFWEGAHHADIRTAADILSILERGLQARETAVTAMNETSSRSHCIFTIYIDQTHELLKEELKSKVHLVDLAGSERLKKIGCNRFQETKSNNKSLSAINACLRALSSPNVTHVPYRASTLTWFLQDSLGGSAKTVFLATISPSISNKIESRQTLHYATFAQKVALSKEEALKLKRDLQSLHPKAKKVF